MNIKRYWKKIQINDLENIKRMSLSCKIFASAYLLSIIIAILENSITMMILFALLAILFVIEERYWNIKYYIFTKYREGGIK